MRARPWWSEVLGASRRKDGTSVVNPAEVDAVVLVGGIGTRLRPLTLSAPKPMLPTAGLPFLTHLLSRIADAGIEHVVLGTSYKAAVFESEFGDGSKLGLQIDYVVEDEPLGTGGGIANVSDKLRHDTALVFNGDVLSGADLRALLGCHENNGADVTLHLVRVGDPRAFGCVPTDSEGMVTAFLEKTQDPPTDQINAGQGSLGKLLKDDAFANSLNGATTSIQDLMAKLNRGEGTAGKLLNDQALYNKLDSVAGRFDELLTKLNAGDGTAGQLLKDKTLYENMNGTVAQLRSLLTAMEKDPKKYLNVRISIF